MRTEIISKERAYELLRKAGIKPVLPYRGYATTISDTSRIGMNPSGEIVLISDDREQGHTIRSGNY